MNSFLRIFVQDYTGGVNGPVLWNLSLLDAQGKAISESYDPSGYNAQFVYAPDRSRQKQISTYAGNTETTIYVAGLFEKLTTTTRTHWKHLIPTPSGQVQVIRRSDGTTDTFLLMASRRCVQHPGLPMLRVNEAIL